MLLIDNPYTNPYFNIALEERLLKQYSESVFMLYRNEPSVIVGKHQNTLAEINTAFVQKYQLPVVRRISGGGTVYHDLGNLNYSSIMTTEKGKMVDFKRYTQPVQQVLSGLGIETYYAKNNSLFANGLKISGNAEHVFKQRALHHGTLLFQADLDKLNESLQVDTSRYQSKAVQSIRSRVVNIAELLNQPLTLEAFKQRLFKAMEAHYPGAVFYGLDYEDVKAVNKLVEEKYRTDQWNFGYSPDYTFEQSFSAYPFDLEVKLQVQKGLIRQAQIVDNNSGMEWQRLEEALQDAPHHPAALEAALQQHFAQNLDEAQRQTLIKAFFA